MAELEYIAVERIHPHPDNPRKELGDLSELADSIKASGVLQNLTIIPSYQVDAVAEQIQSGEIPAADDDQYVVIIGHRRLAAAKLAGLTEVPCVVASMTAKEQVQTMLMENMQRADLTVYEQAQGFQMMIDLGDTVEGVSQKTGFSETTVRRRLKMAELDPAKLKAVSDRQLSIGDFDTLAQIEDIKERNRVLESIGTNDFDANVRAAIRRQKEKHNLPLVKAWLKEVHATELKSSDTYGNKYESYDGRYSISVSEWGEKGSNPPKVGKIPVFYILDQWGSLRLYKKREKAKPEKKSPEQLAKEKKIRDAWGQLEQAASLAHDLRKQFVEKLTVTKKNRPDILFGALIAHLLEAIDYNSPNRDAICNIFGIDTGSYDGKRKEKLVVGIGKIKDADLPALIYAGFGDDAKQMCAGTSYRGDYPRYGMSAKLNLIYVWLQMLGYEMSTEETQLFNGEHPGYHVGEDAK